MHAEKPVWQVLGRGQQVPHAGQSRQNHEQGRSSQPRNLPGPSQSRADSGPASGSTPWPRVRAVRCRWLGTSWGEAGSWGAGWPLGVQAWKPPVPFFPALPCRSCPSLGGSEELLVSDRVQVCPAPGGPASSTSAAQGAPCPTCGPSELGNAGGSAARQARHSRGPLIIIHCGEDHSSSTEALQPSAPDQSRPAPSRAPAPGRAPAPLSLCRGLR